MRCHAALGQHALSASAFDSATELAEAARWLMSLALTMRARATSAQGREWIDAGGRERLAEVLGRMELGGSEEQAALEAALLG